jgi:ureidoglycolate hydrolase
VTELKILPLTSTAFADFGKVLNKVGGDPMGHSAEFNYWGKLGEFHIDGRISSGHLVAFQRPAVVRRLESHARTPEILVALEGDSALCLARPGISPNDGRGGIQAFLLARGDAIVLHPGTWHWIPVPIGCATAAFLVLFAEGTEDNDIAFCDLKAEIELRA